MTFLLSLKTRAIDVFERFRAAPGLAYAAGGAGAALILPPPLELVLVVGLVGALCADKVVAYIKERRNAD